MSAKKSLVWRYFYFKDGEKKYVECSMCHKRLAYKGSTTSMIKHILVFHSHEAKKNDGSEEQTTNCLVEENISEDEIDFGTRIRRSLEKQSTQKKRKMEEMERTPVMEERRKEPETNVQERKKKPETNVEEMERTPVMEERKKKPETNVNHPKETLPSSEASKTLNISGALDQFDHFGQNIAFKLREMDKEQRILAEKLMSDAIFYGQLGRLTVQSAEAFPQILSPNASPYSSSHGIR